MKLEHKHFILWPVKIDHVEYQIHCDPWNNNLWNDCTPFRFNKNKNQRRQLINSRPKLIYWSDWCVKIENHKTKNSLTAPLKRASNFKSHTLTHTHACPPILTEFFEAKLELFNALIGSVRISKLFTASQFHQKCWCWRTIELASALKSNVSHISCWFTHVVSQCFPSNRSQGVFISSRQKVAPAKTQRTSHAANHALALAILAFWRTKAKQQQYFERLIWCCDSFV